MDSEDKMVPIKEISIYLRCDRTNSTFQVSVKVPYDNANKWSLKLLGLSREWMEDQEKQMHDHQN